MSKYSVNNRLIVEAYQKDGLKATVSNGFAMVQQKVALKGLTVLMDAVLSDGRVIKAGSKAYIKEEVLHTHPALKSTLECDTINVRFMVVDLNMVDFIAPPPEGEAA